MDIAEYRKDFYIYVVDDEESIRDVLKETFTQAGYQVSAFADAESALEAIKQSPPHLIFSDIRMPGMSGIELLEQVRKLSSDIEFIIMTSHASLETAVNAMKLGAYDYIFKPFESLPDLIKSADRTIEKIFLKIQNEQLLEELAEKNKKLSDVNVKITQENKEVQLVNQYLQRLAQTLDPDGVIQTFVDSTSELAQKKPAIYFKFISAHSALVASHASGLNAEMIKNVGLNFSSLDAKTLFEKVNHPEQLLELKELMKQVFKVDTFSPYCFTYQNQPHGILIIFGNLGTEEEKKIFESYTRLTQVSYDNALMAKKIHEMAIKDPLTGLYNRRYFNEKLEEEISRSRRTHYPLGLIYLDIDHFKKYNDTNGHPMGDVIIKSVAQILLKTSRKTDIAARLGGEEFAIICPHTPVEGCAIKAEKIRLTVENTKFPHGEKQPLGKVTVSIGVSEYPSICKDTEGLVKTADDVLYKVKQGGRNRVGMAEAPKDFVKDFEPVKELPKRK
ncbi:MAG: diguanylate cyclase [Oligoflexia bacterium]|nr:diguanylate cyclase [Oligoflexia bacterium]